MKRTNNRNEPPGRPSAARRGRAGPAGEDALSHAAAALHRAGFLDATLVLRWREIAGADIARIAEPLKLTDGPEGAVLTLKCEPGAAVFLQHQTRDLLRLVSGELQRPVEPSDHPGAGAGPDEPPGPLTLSQALERLERRRARVRARTR
jgi:hypothetical protein